MVWPALLIARALGVNPNTTMRYSNLHNILRIPHTLRIVSDCWEKAERNLRHSIQKYKPGAHEESITETFHSEFAETLTEASKKLRVSKAFHADLVKAFPQFASCSELHGIATGLIADVTLHERKTEGETGGDLGFMILRPQVEGHGRKLNIGSYRRGILSQAKLKGSDGKWGRFTDKQKEMLPEKLQYLGLLLYSYEDEERRQLRQFQWQLCHSAASIREVTEWLKCNSFPSLVSSNVIIRNVGNGQIGTDNDKILDEIVAPAGNRALIIRISWPKGSGPGSEVHVRSKFSHEQQVKNSAFVRN